MITPDYFSRRWSWYRPILDRGEDPANRCRIDARRLPLRVAGADAGEYIPFALQAQLATALSQSLTLLQDYAVRYLIKGEKVSAHQLPKTDADSRAMIEMLRTQYPHLPRTLLHHWCAEPRGAPALLGLWRDLWVRGWQQEQADAAPWVTAVNVLLLRLMREAMAKLPAEHAEATAHALLCMLGGLYQWSLMEFMKQHADGAVEVIRIVAYESMVLPATPMVFMQHQPDDGLLSDDRQVIMAYGLEPDLVPRMREMRKRLGPKNEAGMLALLGKDKLSAHLLKRSWARLALWDLSGSTGDGTWMRWVLSAKRLDQLLTAPDKLEPVVVEMLEANREHPFAAWLLHQRGGGGLFRRGAGEPWLQDDRTLQAFRVFEEDVAVEIARRRAERTWLDQGGAIAGKARGAEAEKLFEAAYREGRIVWLTPGTEASLHSGTALPSKQACLMVDWSEYLAGMELMRGGQASGFVEKVFFPGVIGLMGGEKKVFMDDVSAAGCALRGPASALAALAVALRQQCHAWYLEAGDEGMAVPPGPVSMCLALVGDWSYAEVAQAGGSPHRFAFAPAVAQASAGLCRDGGVGRLAASRDREAGLRAHGHVRVEGMDAGQRVQLLYNGGLALTAPALTALVAELRERFPVREYHPQPAEVQAALDGFRLPDSRFALYSIGKDGPDAPWLLLRVGRPCLAGVDVDLYELLAPDAPLALAIRENGLKRWRGMSPS